ncbi:hypothetical protein [Azoarcus olearius]|uniref:Conserved hypothetical secreted protein n=1 Tax=Azoarcus sp. (strain BH72) TaxID=418699 RepID=A1K333_AZOSB|nr:hypothetical protein [Azoarcus olearius]ANQ83765.1 hypothetical protein dqs_0690 [Azoarcus olearius]CAL93238.1 conserved hypothetical secreted protein [Azoarcus olearius]
MKPAIPILCLALLLGLAPPARADAPEIRWSAFGTVGAVVTDDEDVRFIRSGIDHPGAESPDFGPDSVLGVQGNINLSEQAGAVLQVISRENPEGDYTPRVTLAFLSYALAPTLTARIGRMRVPFFMLSDSLDINYANPWVRPPIEVYGLNPFSDLDGVDLLYRTRIGNTDLEIHPYAGSSYIPIHRRGNARLRELYGINLALTHDHLSLYLGHAEARVALHWDDNEYNTMTAQLRSFGLGSVVAQLSGNDGYAAFSSAGVQWDDGRWLLIGEYARRENRSYANSAHGWYVTVGRRVGATLPYLSFARHTQDRPTSGSSAVPAGSPFQPFIEGFDKSRNIAQHSTTAGVRWDFTRNAAFKAELSHIRTDPDAWGSLFPRGNPAFARMGDRSYNVLSVSVDVAF